MANRNQPLNIRTAIVNEDGTPNQYFLRWMQDQGFDIDGKATIDEVTAAINAWAAARSIIAGNGLTGGGTLASNVTLDVNPAAAGGLEIISDALQLKDTAVTPGSYTNANITVDQKGRLTAAANGSGGGGGSKVGEFSYTAPTTTDLPVILTLGTATCTTTSVTNKGLAAKLVASASAAAAFVGIAAPSAPWCIAMRMSGFGGSPFSNSLGHGLCVRNGSGRVSTIYRAQDGNAYLQNWNTIDSFNSNLVTGPPLTRFLPPTYFAISLDGSGNLNYYYSNDGYNWALMGTNTVASWVVTLTHVGFHMYRDFGAGREAYGMIESWALVNGSTTPPTMT